MNPQFLLFAGAVLLAYAASLWWMLRRESVHALLALVALCGVAAALRLVYTTDYPAGLNEDEVKRLFCATAELGRGSLWSDDCTGWPALLEVLFQAQLAPLFGAGRWAIRTYPLVTGVLSVPLTFAAARGLRMRTIGSLVAAALVAVLPWSLLYGRVSSGGELIFHEMLLVAALARLVGGSGRWAEVGIGALGIGGLFYDYGCGRPLVLLPLGAALLARGWRRALCVAVTIVGLLTWAPYVWHAYLPVFLNSFTAHVQVDAATPLWARAATGLLAVGRALVWPLASDGWLTVRAGAVHPWLALALAAVGVLVPKVRSLFLLGGFFLGVAPGMLTDGPAPSAHRLLMAFPFIALAAGSAIDLLRWRVVEPMVAALVVVIIGVQSVAFYFSDDFWTESSRVIFDWENTALAEALPAPPHPRFIVAQQIGQHFFTRTQFDDNFEYLTADNWFPSNRGAIYVFGPIAALLQPFYRDIAGQERVQSFGRVFLARFEPGNWAWLRQHGWTYSARCGASVKHGQVPALFHANLTFGDLKCPGAIEHVWRGRWLGQHTDMELRFTGSASVDIGDRRVVEQSGTDVRADFPIEPNDEVTVRLRTPEDNNYMAIALFQVTPAGDRVPPWDWVDPLSDAAAALPPADAAREP